jgi:hypothetical protein
VTISWLPRQADQDQGAKAPPRLTITATGADGQVYFDGPLEGKAVSFAAPAGELTIRRTILDPDGTAGERQDLPMTVPDFDTAPLVIATPVVSRARTGVELNALRAAKDLTPYAGHDFDRTDRLLVRFTVYGRAASGAAVTVRLLNKRGDALTPLQFRERQGDPGSYEIELPLGSVARGDYLIAIEAAHGDQQVRTLVPFRAQ